MTNSNLKTPGSAGGRTQGRGAGLVYDNVFVVTYGRSGSTLLQGLLNTIDGMLIRGENNNFIHPLFDAWRALSHAKSTQSATSLAPADPWYGIHVVDTDAFLANLRQTVLDVLLGDRAGDAGIRCVGFKEIRYVEIGNDMVPFLGFLALLFPNAGFIGLTRDHEQVAKSGWWAQENPDTVRGLLRAFDDRIRAFAAENPHVFLIDYADIIDRTDVLRDMFTFLGAPYIEEDVTEILGTPHSFVAGLKPAQEPETPYVAIKKPVFVLGVGAQKAGTTWLWKQLSAHPAVNTGFTKEYHVWNRFLTPDSDVPLAKGVVGETDKAALLRLMRLSPGSYETYFKSLINDTIRCTGDITPGYAGLKVGRLKKIKYSLEAAGFRVKVAFIMRDPAHRNWSAMRMFHREGTQFADVTSQQQLLNRFDGFFKRRNMEMRTRYDLTVQNLRSVFHEENIFFGFYETLFRDDTMAEMYHFLDLPPVPADFGDKVGTFDSIPLPQERYDACRAHYAGVYDFCETHFPITADIWNGAA